MAGNSPTIKFGINHPFWQQAVELRAHPSAKTISEILDIAHAAGYTDLEYHNIHRGLKKAPADKYLPATSSKYLQRKFQSISNDFDAFEHMKNLTFEAMSKIGELEEELEDESLSQSRRMYIDSQLWKWYGRAMEWSAKCSDIAIKLRSLNTKETSGPILASHEDITEQSRHLEQLMSDLRDDFNRRLPSSPDISLLSVYGSDNVRLPGREIEDDGGDSEE